MEVCLYAIVGKALTWVKRSHFSQDTLVCVLTSLQHFALFHNLHRSDVFISAVAWLKLPRAGAEVRVVTSEQQTDDTGQHGSSSGLWSGWRPRCTQRVSIATRWADTLLVLDKNKGQEEHWLLSISNVSIYHHGDAFIDKYDIWWPLWSKASWNTIGRRGNRSRHPGSVDFVLYHLTYATLLDIKDQEVGPLAKIGQVGKTQKLGITTRT